MRRVEFRPRAVKAIDSVCEFIESKNTPGSSVKWYSNVVQFIINRAQVETLQFPLCNYPKFVTRGFSCFIYKKEWIIVFKYSSRKLTVYRFVHGTRLK